MHLLGICPSVCPSVGPQQQIYCRFAAVGRRYQLIAAWHMAPRCAVGDCVVGWLGGRKGIRPVKNRVVGCWCGYLPGARCRLAYGLADATATVSCFSKIQIGLPFWYRLTRIVPEKKSIKHVCVCVCCMVHSIAGCDWCHVVSVRSSRTQTCMFVGLVYVCLCHVAFVFR